MNANSPTEQVPRTGFGACKVYELALLRKLVRRGIWATGRTSMCRDLRMLVEHVLLAGVKSRNVSAIYIC